MCAAGPPRRARTETAQLRLPDQQDATNDDRANAGPDRNVDGLLLLHVDLYRAEFGLVVFLGICEPAIPQTQGAADDERECKDANALHDVFSHGRLIERCGTGARQTALQQAPAPDQAHQNHDDRDDEQNVDETAHRV